MILMKLNKTIKKGTIIKISNRFYVPRTNEVGVQMIGGCLDEQ